MKNINLKNSLYIVLIFSIIVFFILVEVNNIKEITLWGAIKLVSTVVSIDLLFISTFSAFFWKYKIFRGWLVLFPNLNGTWKGFIQTTWVDPISKERPGPIPAILTIHQTFISISCVMRTSEMKSQSIIGDFSLDKDNQVKRLIYSYDSKPIEKVKERSPEHCGTMMFDIIEGKQKIKLIGVYWTGRKTTGDIEMDFWKKEKLEEFPKDLGEHPVSKVRDNKN